MDNVVEKIISKGQASTGQPQSTSPEAGSGDAKELSRYTQRVHELANENATLRGRLEALEEQYSQRSQPQGEDRPSPRSWGEFSDAQLERVAYDAEVSEQTRFQAMRELNERKMKEVAEEYYQKGLKTVGESSYKERVMGGLMSTFGESIQNQESPLWREAQGVYGELEKRYGKESLERMPELTELAFYKAHHSVTQSEREELARLRDLERQVAAAGGVQPRVSSGPIEDPSMKEALGNKDVRSAAKALTKRMLEMHQAQARR